MPKNKCTSLQSEEYKLKYILLTVLHSPRVCGSVGSADTTARRPFTIVSVVMAVSQ